MARSLLTSARIKFIKTPYQPELSLALISLQLESVPLLDLLHVKHELTLMNLIMHTHEQSNLVLLDSLHMWRLSSGVSELMHSGPMQKRVLAWEINMVRGGIGSQTYVV